MKAAEENADKGAGFPYDKGQEMPGVKTVEGAVNGGLRYRLRMDPNAAREGPDRLVVWLHPAGGYGNNVAEALAPVFLRHGFALLVFTQKESAAWSGTDFERAMKTAQEVGRLEGIDANRPILMGYSAGGQAALMQWADKPGELGVPFEGRAPWAAGSARRGPAWTPARRLDTRHPRISPPSSPGLSAHCMSAARPPAP